VLGWLLSLDSQTNDNMKHGIAPENAVEIDSLKVARHFWIIDYIENSRINNVNEKNIV